MPIQSVADNTMKAGMIKFSDIEDISKGSQIGYDPKKMESKGLLKNAQENAEKLSSANEPGKGGLIDISA
ncbi:MAG: hypothetical protein ACYTFY_07725 [Planctomycetota bacterium]|jgi:hypothetical protein